MKTLEQHNEEATMRFNLTPPLACPCCGHRLVDVDTVIHPSTPPMRRVKCSNKDYCNHWDYRVI